MRIGSFCFKNKTEFTFHKSPILVTGFWVLNTCNVQNRVWTGQTHPRWCPWAFYFTTCHSFNDTKNAQSIRDYIFFSLIHTKHTHWAEAFVMEWRVSSHLWRGQARLREDGAKPLQTWTLPRSLNCFTWHVISALYSAVSSFVSEDNDVYPTGPLWGLVRVVLLLLMWVGTSTGLTVIHVVTECLL